MDLPPEATALLALPPARFTAARDALARELASRGDASAAAVRRLRRPAGLAWVLNRLARERPAELRALLEAGDRLRAGQRRAVSGAGGEALRQADAAVRERARGLRLEAERILAAEGRPATAAVLARLELLLRVGATGGARAALEEGTLSHEPAVGEAALSGLTLLAGGVPGSAPPAPAAAPLRRARPERRRAPERPARGARAAAGGAAEREATTRERHAEIRARAARREAERAARDAERTRREHARAVAAAHAAAARAIARAEKAERAAELAEQRTRELRDRAATARTEANRATARALEVERGG